VAFGSARQKSLHAALMQDYGAIQLQVDIARNENQKILGGPYGITGVFSSNNLFDLSTIPVDKNSTALAYLNNSWTKIGFSSMPKDPWGRPFILYENEGRSNSPSSSWNDCTTHDQVISAGSNDIYESASVTSSGPPGVITRGDGDDYIFALTFYSCKEPGGDFQAIN